MKQMKIQALLAMLLALALVIALISAASAVEDGVKYTVDGESFPLSQLTPQTYEKLPNGDVRGVTTPIILSCPGAIGFGTPGAFCTTPASPYGPNGWQGTIVAKETVLRQLSSSNSPPPFSSTVDQYFSGFVVVDGVQLYGTMVMTMSVSGVLNEPPGVDCYATPENPGCGAANYTGKWRIIPGTGTQELEGIRGEGATEWKGCTFTGTGLVCVAPTYLGEIEFGPDLYLPAILG